ncbi:MAG TPA: carboxypeptidase M32 [Solirubrobacteraceae bacterium]|jgi:carboxypeptidase Taq|nr:carboxypeptidase M32 [Solirubrobacteraceae bacterium]
MAELEDLRNASAVLGWDQQTMMPPGGAPQRSETLATLQRIRHERFISEDTGRLIEEARASLDGVAEDSDERCLVRFVSRRWNKSRRVPAKLAADMARAFSVGQKAWIDARREDDFGAFVPYLKHNLELTRRYVDCFDHYDCAYDVVLDDYEPEMRTEHVARLFDQLKRELVPLISELGRHSVDDSYLHGEFPVTKQRQLIDQVLPLMGFDSQRWRLDDAVHPFATSIGSSDVRITTRWDASYFPSALFGAMHECGHGLYEAGIASSLQRTPLGHGLSLGVHESQSRLWENMVGRGRSFSNVLGPLVAGTFGGRLADISPDMLFRAVNRSYPSLIRVEADEVTYGLHIILRFEIEQELIEGRLRVEDLPEAWNSRMHDYVGIEVPSDARGVLQDVHWSAGLIGYFPTYALGNMIAGQLWRQVHLDVPDLEEQIAAGELGGLRGWLTEHVHRHGSKFTTTELLERAVGADVQVEPFIDYLKAKLGDVYGISLTQPPQEKNQ